MSTITILCVEDEPEVRDAILRDLEPFAGLFRIEAADDVDDARSVVRELESDGDRLGLALCDHMMPGTSGVDFLVELTGQPAQTDVRKVLITGQAGLEDTIRAVNMAQLHHYIAKPWQAEDLQEVVRHQLTEFVLATQEDLLPFVSVLETERLLEAVAKRRMSE